jgi:hypothetical protein
VDSPQGRSGFSDLGYFSLTLLANFSDDGVYWLTRIKSNCVLYDKEGKRFSLVEFLKKQRADKIDLPIFLGSLEKLPCRFIAVRLPEKIANQRRRKIRTDAQKKGRTPSKRRLAKSVGFACTFWQTGLFMLLTSHLSG